MTLPREMLITRDHCTWVRGTVVAYLPNGNPLVADSDSFGNEVYVEWSAAKELPDYRAAPITIAEAVSVIEELATGYRRIGGLDTAYDAEIQRAEAFIKKFKLSNKELNHAN